MDADTAFTVIQDKIAELVEMNREAAPVMADAADHWENFLDWMAEDSFQRTYQDFAVTTQDAVALYGNHPDSPAWVKGISVEAGWQAILFRSLIHIYKEADAAAKEGKKIAETAKATQTVTAKARKVAKEIFRRNSGLILGIGVFALLFALMATSLSSCSALFQGGGTIIIGTTYASTDEEIYAVENAYSALEEALNCLLYTSRCV